MSMLVCMPCHPQNDDLIRACTNNFVFGYRYLCVA